MWIAALLQKPAGLLLVKKFTTYCGARRFITTFTIVWCLCSSWARSVICARIADINFTFQRPFREFGRLLLFFYFYFELRFHITPFSLLIIDLLVTLSAGLFSEISAAIYCRMVGRDSSVGIATRYGLTVRGSNPGGGRDFPHPSRRGLVLTTHPHLSAEVKKE